MQNLLQLLLVAPLAMSMQAASADALGTAVPSTTCQPDATVGVPMRIRTGVGLRFQDVVDDLEFAITERNFRITGRNTIGKGLRERGYSGYPEYEVIHFCNLENAKQVLDLDPRFVAQMPCRVTVHTEGEVIVVSMLLLSEDHALPEVRSFAERLNGELCAIQDFALP